MNPVISNQLSIKQNKSMSSSVEPIQSGKGQIAGNGRSIGVILVDTGRLSVKDAEKVLRLQKDQGKRFGDAAIDLGLVTQDDIRFALSQQFDYPYLPDGDASLSDELVAAYKPFSPAVEKLRTLRSQLMLRWFNAERQNNALTIMSPGNKEGRSFIAANLSIVFSQLGERTLLIDADLRAPRQPEAVVRVPTLLGLSVLPAGAIPPNPQELLGRPGFTLLLESLIRDFDVVIIDTPAASEHDEAQLIATRAGAALMLARTNISSIPEVTQLARSLQQNGAMVVGSVLNDF
jgi:Mrp family chromosome partitioning ATPase